MADLATPAAATMGTMGTIDAGPTAPKSDSKPKITHVEKPERPDEQQYNADLAKAEKNLASSNERLKAIKAKLDSRPNNKDSPQGKRQQELRAEQAQIRTQQQSTKSSRAQVMEKMKRFDENLKSRIAEQKTARSRVAFKSVEDVQREIDRLQKQVDTGMMKLVDEKKALAEISSLNKQKKGFAGFDQTQKGIDDVKAQITELRKQMDDPESKAQSDRYTAISKALDDIKGEQDEVYKNLNSLRDERTKANADQNGKYAAVKEIKDKYFQAKRANREYEQEARRIRNEKYKSEQEAYQRGKRREVADSKLEEASEPAYGAEIRTTQALLGHFDPSFAPTKEAAIAGKLAASATRTVDDSGIKGTRLAKKGGDEEDYFVGTGGKKGKKGRKGGANGTASPVPPAAETGKFNLDYGTINKMTEIGIDPPMTQGDVPAVVEKLKAKLDFWKSDQDRKTKDNIANAQKEIDRLEAEATAADTNGTTDKATKPAKSNAETNGQASAGAEMEKGQDAAADVSKELEAAKIEDESSPESTS